MANANEHSIVKIASNLAMACFISGLVIGAVYYVTAPVAAQKAEEMKQESMRSLVAEADDFKEIPGEEGCFAAEKDGRTVAYIIPSESKGYGGRIKLLVAVDTEGKVLDFNILEHNETPGLGDRIDRKHGDYLDAFSGLGLEDAKWDVKKYGGDFDYFTGATVTSRAAVLAMRDALKTLEKTDIQRLKDCGKTRGEIR